MMLKLRTVILIVFFITLFMLIGCKKEASYLTIIRNNPNGTIEQWKTSSKGVTWNSGGSITFTPFSLSHEISITGCLTVFSTKIVIDQTTNKEVKGEKSSTKIIVDQTTVKEEKKSG